MTYAITILTTAGSAFLITRTLILALAYPDALQAVTTLAKWCWFTAAVLAIGYWLGSS